MAGTKKSLGQHWLYDRQILDSIASAAAPAPPQNPNNSPSDPSSPTRTNSKQFINTCLEIGPGLGTLTSSLFKKFPHIIAVELDHQLAANLPKSFPGKNLEVIEQDFLDFDLSKVPSPYVVAGNIPYYITSPIITKLLTAQNRPQRIALLIQKEVALRFAAPHGSLAALQVQNLATPALGPFVPRNFFTPPPKVDSQVLILTPHDPLISPEALSLAKLGFSSPRKKLAANLPPFSKAEIKQLLIKLNLNPDSRPADLTLSDWQNLAFLLKNH